MTELIERDLTDHQLKEEIDGIADQKIRICADGTYLFHERPSDIETFKENYSVPKRKHLTKLHLYSTTNGYVLQVNCLSIAVF